MPAYRTAANTYARFTYSYRSTGGLENTAGAASQILVPTRIVVPPIPLVTDLYGIEEVAAGTVYDDLPAGTILLSGTKTESLSHDAARSGTIVLSGTRTESLSHDSTRSGTILLAGAITESKAYTETRTGTIVLAGAISESWSHDASRRGESSPPARRRRPCRPRPLRSRRGR